MNPDDTRAHVRIEPSATSAAPPRASTLMSGLAGGAGRGCGPKPGYQTGPACPPGPAVALVVQT